jgi:flavin reductase (NADH)/cob(II)yrinic acid a,c-diamide reductase
MPDAVSSPSLPNNLGDDFKEVMRRLAATVCVLTTAHEGVRWGLTATAVCSLSVNPPSLIVCINRGADAAPAIEASGRLCVNLASHRQQDVAERFSGMLGHKGEARFEGFEWVSLNKGGVALADATASLDCAVHERLVHGTHMVLICRVEAIVIGKHRTALLYGDRSFCDLVTRAAKA